MSGTKSAAARQMEDMGLEWDYEITPETGLREVEISGRTDEKAWGNQGEIKIPGLTRCLGIAVLDHSDGSGYAMHFTTENRSVDFSGDANFYETVAAPLQDFNSALMAHDVDFENAEAVVAGSNYSIQAADRFLGDSQEMQEIAKGGAVRGIAEQYVDNYFGESHAYWDMDDGYMGELTLDLDEKRIDYDPASDSIRSRVQETV